MEAKIALLPHGHELIKTLAPRRYPAAELCRLFREAYPDDFAPKQALGMVWRALGLRCIKSRGNRFWQVPESIPPMGSVEVKTPTQPRRIRAKRRYTVDLTPLHMQPGDGVWVTVTPDAITIRKATA